MNVEADDAGRLRAFRQRFGRGWDAQTNVEEEDMEAEGESEGQGGAGFAEEDDSNLMDLISGYGQEAEKAGKAEGVRENKEKSGKGKGGER